PRRPRRLPPRCRREPGRRAPPTPRGWRSPPGRWRRWRPRRSTCGGDSARSCEVSPAEDEARRDQEDGDVRQTVAAGDADVAPVDEVSVDADRLALPGDPTA